MSKHFAVRISALSAALACLVLAIGCDDSSTRGEAEADASMGQGFDATGRGAEGDACQRDADCPDEGAVCLRASPGSAGRCEQRTAPCQGDQRFDDAACRDDSDAGVDFGHDETSLDAEAISDIGQADAAQDLSAPDIGEDAASESPSGPILPPDGADPTPEESDFDWSSVGNTIIERLVPQVGDGLQRYPRYGSARILDESDSEQCVCFDLECAACNRDACGPEVCTYDLNDNHSLTKYHVELSAIDGPPIAIRFEVNVSAEPPIQYTDISDVLRRLERIPTPYWYGFQIITEFGRGIQFLHGSYFNGAAAYGSMNYIDTQVVSLPTILHELGHTFEQYTRIGHPPRLAPQSNILDPVWRHAIRADNNRTSRYGNSNEWEDLAEFARIYAEALVADGLPQLNQISPERYRIWERILLNGSAIGE